MTDTKLTAQQRNIDDLMALIGDLAMELSDARARLRSAQIEACGVKIGDIVICGAREYRVVEINPERGGLPWLFGNPRKKDGAFGSRVYCLYNDWTSKP